MSGRVLRWVWEWWQAPATEPKRNRWHSQRWTSVTAPSKSGPVFLPFRKLLVCAPHGPGPGRGLSALAPRRRGLASAKRWGFGERACAVRCWGVLRSGRTLRSVAGAGRCRIIGLAPRFRHTPLAGAPDPRARCCLLWHICGSTLGTFVPEVVAARVRRALVATQRRLPYVVDSATDFQRPPHGVHAFGAAQLSHAHLIQGCALCEDDLSRRPARAGVYPGRARKAVIYSYSQDKYS